jgi:hypothetical protein
MAPSRRSGGEECLLTPLPIDSIAYAYMTMTGAVANYLAAWTADEAALA